MNNLFTFDVLLLINPLVFFSVGLVGNLIFLNHKWNLIVIPVLVIPISSYVITAHQHMDEMPFSTLLIYAFIYGLLSFAGVLSSRYIIRVLRKLVK